MTLLERTQELLNAVTAAGINLREIAEESRGAINYEWLKKFSARKVDDPGVNRVETLHKHLAAIKKRTRASQRRQDETPEQNATEG
jgi:hypothetical protein